MQRQSGPSMLLQKMERLSEKQSIAQTAVLVFFLGVHSDRKTCGRCGYSVKIE